MTSERRRGEVLCNAIISHQHNSHIRDNRVYDILLAPEVKIDLSFPFSHLPLLTSLSSLSWQAESLRLVCDGDIKLPFEIHRRLAHLKRMFSSFSFFIFILKTPFLLLLNVPPLTYSTPHHLLDHSTAFNSTNHKKIFRFFPFNCTLSRFSDLVDLGLFYTSDSYHFFSFFQEWISLRIQSIHQQQHCQRTLLVSVFPSIPGSSGSINFWFHQLFRITSLRTFAMTVHKDLLKKGRKSAKSIARSSTANSASGTETSPAPPIPVHSVEATHSAPTTHGEEDDSLLEFLTDQIRPNLNSIRIRIRIAGQWIWVGISTEE